MPAARQETAGMELVEWLAQREGIAHRADILRAGYRVAEMRRFVRDRRARVIRRAWVTLPDAAPDLVLAASAGGRISCLSLARRRGWWMPPDLDPHPHLHLIPGSGSARLPAGWRGRVHWTTPLAPQERGLTATVEDALLHISGCAPHDAALALWESAIRVEGFAPEAVRRVGWTSRAARELADEVVGLSDSGLETLVVLPLRRWGVPVVQQARVGGRFVDLLVGERLVLQIDGFAHHASSAQRTKDIAHDAELTLRGYTVLRLSYAQIVYDWPAVERRIRSALAARLHLAS